ncbi:class I SAM-dependent DNA methyltransferase [Sphingomonas koreensis]|nr:class I SAM-dependent DNA methyltransferase [Sphingomonas koreensis]
MRLGWDEIKRRARAFSEEWRDAHYEKGETQSFYNDFFEIFGVRRRTVASYERRVESIDANRRGFIDLFWPGILIVEQKSGGRDLLKAQGQALEYFDWLPDNQKPRYILTCDFQRWHLIDLDTNQEWRFALGDLHKHIEAFAFVLGRQRSFTTQATVTIKAAELMGKLHDALEASGYAGHDLEHLLVRLLFCLFADDTGIFQPAQIFLQLLESETADDGHDTGRVLMELFDILDTPDGQNGTVNQRQSGLSAELNAFPYVNGNLFTGRLRTPVFDTAMRGLLIDACRHNWSGVSPAIFGSLFQSVMDAKERRAKGAHYTSEANILKVIGPLFLDDLTAELERILARKTEREKLLDAFVAKLARLTFLDPACGCGNFLVIAYRELRRLELAALEARWPRAMTDTGEERRQGIIDPGLLSRVQVNQFYGIEVEEFPAAIAEVAMWMADHLANNALGEAFSTNYARIPLRDSAHILHADALDTDWSSLIVPEKLHYIMGNPPFVVAKFQTAEQRAQVRAIAQLGGSGGTLDFVAAWFIKAGQFVATNHRIRIAFVATNSISQGEQVAQLWPILFDRFHLEIAFAHRTFSWGSEARGKAHVHVVVIGLTHRDDQPTEKRLFSYPDIRGEPIESRHEALTAYLFDARGVTNRHLVVKEEGSAINGARKLASGSQPIDGGHLIFDWAARRDFLESEPSAKMFMRRYVGAEDFINGGKRWILALQKATPSELRAMPQVLKRLKLVREFRRASQRKSTLAIADQPTRFNVEVLPTKPFLAIPEVSSERREYIPFGWLKASMIPSNKLRMLPTASLWEFGVLTSRAHNAWLGHVGGRLESRFQYGIGIVYNTFPWPDATPAQRARIEALAQAVLDARAAHPTASLADLYDPDTMPGDLRRAHHALDLAVDKLYRAAPFASDRDRVEHLFGRYEALVNPLATSGVKANRRVARRKAKDAD